MAARRSIDEETRELRVRVTDLEARVRWLERKLKRVAEAARVAPEPAQGKGPARPRCPSCFTEVPRRQRETSCMYCGFCFEVVAPIRPRRPR